MEKTQKFNLLYKLCCWVIGGIFIYAGILKLLEPEVFAVQIKGYGLIPEKLAMPAAVCLPLLEVAAGIGLVFDIKASLALTAGLLTLFTAAVGYGIWMGLNIDCGCFGRQDPEFKAFHNLWLVFFRDIIMLGAVAFIYLMRRHTAIVPVSAKAAVLKLFTRK